MPWNLPAHPIRLTPHEVHVWRLHLAQPVEVAERLASVLSADERERAERLMFAADRQAFVVCRGMLRTLLSQYGCGLPKELRFQYNAEGKPALLQPSQPGIEFSVSHSGGQALLAFAGNSAVGVDLERIRPLTNLSGMVKTCLSPAELIAFQRLPENQRLPTFFRAWTRKEALVKGLGQGLSKPLTELDVAFASGSADWQGWQVLELDAGSEFAAALAIRQPGLMLKRFDAAAVVN